MSRELTARPSGSVATGGLGYGAVQLPDYMATRLPVHPAAPVLDCREDLPPVGLPVRQFGFTATGVPVPLGSQLSDYMTAWQPVHGAVRLLDYMEWHCRPLGRGLVTSGLALADGGR